MTDSCIQVLKEKVHDDIMFFNHWYDFQLNVNLYLPKENLQKLLDEKYPGAVLDLMIHNPQTRAMIKGLVLQKCDLSIEVDYDIFAQNLPYVMLDPQIINRLILIIGALVCFKNITKIISKKQLEKICNFIGRDVYMFVLKRSLLFWKKIPKFNEKDQLRSLEKRIQLYGKRVFEYLIHDLPDSVIKRLNLRTGMNFAGGVTVSEQDFLKAQELTKYAITNFFANDEGAKLCLK